MLVMVPTRGRPAKCERFAKAFAGTVQGETDLLWIIDEDDGSYAGEAGRVLSSSGEVLTMVSRRRTAIPTLVEKLNCAAGASAGKYPVLMFTGDDTVPETPGWDKLLVEAINSMGGTGFSYPEDHSRNDIPEHVAMSSDIVRALGWFAQPSLKHFYIDNVWADLGRATGRIRFVPEAVLDHLHANRGLAENDATYRRASTFYPGDYTRYLAWRANSLEHDVATIQGLL